MAIITLNNNSLSNISSLPTGLGGKVLQIVDSNFATLGTFTQSTDVTAGSITITPSSTSSKILLMSRGRVEAYDYSSGDDMNQSAYGIFVRTISGSSTTLYTARNHSSSAGSSYRRFGEHIASNYVDSPNTVSEITYTLKVRAETQEASRDGYGAEFGLTAIEVGS